VYEELLDLFDKHYATIPHDALLILSHLYGALTALDITSAAILTFDAILVAAAINSAKDYKTDTEPVAHYLARAVTVVALLSAGLALLVDRVSYPFWGYVKEIEPRTLDFTVEFQKLDVEILRRTRLYRGAWFLSLSAVVIFLLCIFWPWIRTTWLAQQVGALLSWLRKRLSAKSSSAAQS
jgi:hypothetical protein